MNFTGADSQQIMFLLPCILHSMYWLFEIICPRSRKPIFQIRLYRRADKMSRGSMFITNLSEVLGRNDRHDQRRNL